MLVLGIDTATRFGSVGIVALANGPSERRPAPELVAEASCDAGLQHGESLLPLIDDCLGRAGLDLEAIDLVAVSIGPGSFTGLRVGLATAKGLVLGTRAKVVGVPTLMALAATLLRDLRGPAEAPADWATGPEALVCPCLDARRGEVYGALFAADLSGTSAAAPGALRRLLPDRVSAPEGLARAIREVRTGRAGERPDGAPLVFVGDGGGRHAERLCAELGDVRILPFAAFPPRGAAVAAVGAGLLADRGADDPATLAPLYTRSSDAERARAARGQPVGPAESR